MPPDPAGSTSSDTSRSENPYEQYDGGSSNLKFRKDRTPCTISGSSSENNLYASAEADPSLSKGFNSELHLDSMHLKMEQFAYEQQYNYSLRRKCKERGFTEEMYSKLNRSNVAGDSARNYSSLKLELMDFYEGSPSRDVALQKPDFRDIQECYMVPTHDPNRVDEKSLSLFNPQFLPNFNDMVMFVAQSDAKNSRQFYPNVARLENDFDFVKPTSYRNDVHCERVFQSGSNDKSHSQRNVDTEKFVRLGYPQTLKAKTKTEDIFILKRQLRESTWNEKFDLRDCKS